MNNSGQLLKEHKRAVQIKYDDSEVIHILPWPNPHMKFVDMVISRPDDNHVVELKAQQHDTHTLSVLLELAEVQYSLVYTRIMMSLTGLCHRLFIGGSGRPQLDYTIKFTGSNVLCVAVGEIFRLQHATEPRKDAKDGKDGKGDRIYKQILKKAARTEAINNTDIIGIYSPELQHVLINPQYKRQTFAHMMGSLVIVEPDQLCRPNLVNQLIDYVTNGIIPIYDPDCKRIELEQPLSLPDMLKQHFNISTNGQADFAYHKITKTLNKKQEEQLARFRPYTIKRDMYELDIPELYPLFAWRTLYVTDVRPSDAGSIAQEIINRRRRTNGKIKYLEQRRDRKLTMAQIHQRSPSHCPRYEEIWCRQKKSWMRAEIKEAYWDYLQEAEDD